MHPPEAGATVAVVVPFYNDSETLPRALRSISEQTVGVKSVIIVNDASAADEVLALDQIIQSFERLPIRLLSFRQNVGPSAARNAGWDLADTRYVAFLDADDSWRPDKISLQLNVLESAGAVGLVGTEAELPRGSDFSMGMDVVAPVARVSWQRQVLRNRFVTSSVMVRNAIACRFDARLRYSEDNDLWCRLLLTECEGAVIGAPLTRFHKSPRSRSGASGRYGRMLAGQLRVFWGLRSADMISRSWMGAAMTSALLRFGRRMLFVGVDRCREVLRGWRERRGF